MASAGDAIQAIPDRGWVSFMYSYPNLIPLPAQQVSRIRDSIQRWPFERLYGGWSGKAVLSDAQGAVIRSADCYVGILNGSVQRRYFLSQVAMCCLNHTAGSRMRIK